VRGRDREMVVVWLRNLGRNWSRIVWGGRRVFVLWGWRGLIFRIPNYSNPQEKAPSPPPTPSSSPPKNASTPTESSKTPTPPSPPPPPSKKQCPANRPQSCHANTSQTAQQKVRQILDPCGFKASSLNSWSADNGYSIAAGEKARNSRCRNLKYRVATTRRKAR